MSASSERKETWTCPHCGRRFGTKSVGGHKTHCGVENPPGTIWSQKRPPFPFGGSVYLLETIEGPHRVKIGFTGGDVRSRVRGVQSLAAVRVELRVSSPGTRVDEWELHQRFRDAWVHGEWFDGSVAVEAERRIRELGAA